MSEPREASLSAWAARVVAIEGERDEARAERDALRAQLEAALIERDACRVELQQTVEMHDRDIDDLADMAAERDAARADVDTLLEAIATVGGSSRTGSSGLRPLFGVANEIAAKRGDRQRQDARITALEGENERLRVRASVYRDALEVIAAEGAWPYEPLQRLVREALAAGSR